MSDFRCPSHRQMGRELHARRTGGLHAVAQAGGVTTGPQHDSWIGAFGRHVTGGGHAGIEHAIGAAGGAQQAGAHTGGGHGGGHGGGALNTVTFGSRDMAPYNGPGKLSAPTASGAVTGSPPRNTPALHTRCMYCRPSGPTTVIKDIA